MFMEMLSEELIKKISKSKGEDEWMLEFRLNSYRKFLELENPNFGPKIELDFSKLNYYKKEGNLTSDWNNVRCDIRNKFKTLGVIDAEKEHLSGVSNQFESEVIYHHGRDEIQEKGVIFLSTDEALKQYPDLFKEYFNNLVKYDENKYTALNGALWSGGSFIYIPPYTKLDRPLQSYFRIESSSLGQFERTIIIVDEGAELSYIEGCTAKSYSVSSLHAGVVEIYVKRGAKCKYSTIQNWSKDVYNLVTKRAIVEENGVMDWVDGNVGSGVTMKYPSCILLGDNAVGNSISIAYAKENQHLDAGAKMIHIGANTRSNIVSKSIADEGGIANYRGKVKIAESAKNAYASIKCDTILLSDNAISDTYPINEVNNDSSKLEHEATVSKISEEKMFYLRSKGLTENQAKEMLIMGFISDFKRELPMEYAVELNRLMKEI
ncbi:Fe-S cluster assembly protein SufB [bacterium]|nr:Fe-S cluster assembly protein SufB [bacterium]